MAPRKPLGITRFLNSKSSWSIRALEVLESIHRYTRSSRCKLKETGLAFRRPGTNTLPKPFNDLISLFVTAVIREFRPVISVYRTSTYDLQDREGKDGNVHVYFRHATNQELEFSLVEDIDKVTRNEL
jgi:hypothetical protein